jgi:endonuclease YncB( thermonuclease family)
MKQKKPVFNRLSFSFWESIRLAQAKYNLASFSLLCQDAIIFLGMKLKKIKDLIIKQRLSFLGIIVLISSLGLNFYLYNQNQELESVYLVEEVIDGDSFILKNNQSVRLGNLDAPEDEFCGAEQAKQRLEELILGKTVRLDVFGRDRFNRPIALVYVGSLLVNKVLLEEGLVRYEGTNSPQRDILRKAYDDDYKNKKGIFSSLCLQEKPEDPKCLIKGNISRNDGKKIYHFPGCGEYEITLVEKDLGESWFCSEKEAQAAGYEKSVNCFGKKY